MNERPDLLKFIHTCNLIDFYKEVRIFYVPTIDSNAKNLLKNKQFITQIDIDNFDYEFIGFKCDIPKEYKSNMISIFNFSSIYQQPDLDIFFHNIIKQNQIKFFIRKENHFNKNQDVFLSVIPIFFFKKMIPHLSDLFVSQLLLKKNIPKDYIIKLLKFYKSSPKLNQEIRRYIKSRPIHEQKEYFPYIL